MHNFKSLISVTEGQLSIINSIDTINDVLIVLCELLHTDKLKMHKSLTYSDLSFINHIHKYNNHEMKITLVIRCFMNHFTM